MQTFPVNENFTRDPEVLELRRKFGDWMGFVWLQMLALAHDTDGIIKGQLGELAALLTEQAPQDQRREPHYMKLAWKQITPAGRILHAFVWMREHNWITISEGPTLDFKEKSVNHSPTNLPTILGTNLPTNLPTILGPICMLKIRNHAKYKQSAVKFASAPRTRTERTNLIDSSLVEKKGSVRGGETKTKFPRGFILTDDIAEFARQKGVEDPAEEFSLFKDHHLSVGSTFDDWEAAWRTWVQRGVRQFQSKRKSTTTTTTRSTKYQGLTKPEDK